MHVLRQRRLFTSGLLAALVLALTLVSIGVHGHEDALDGGTSCAVCVVAKHAPAVTVSVVAVELVALTRELVPAARPLRLVSSARRPYAGRAPPHLHV